MLKKSFHVFYGLPCLFPTNLRFLIYSHTNGFADQLLGQTAQNLSQLLGRFLLKAGGTRDRISHGAKSSQKETKPFQFEGYGLVGMMAMG